MTIRSKHVHRLELQKFFVLRIHQLDWYRDEITVFLIFDMVVNN